MALLTETERQQVWRGLMRYWSTQLEPLSSIEKAELRQAVDDTDQWIEDNQTSYNNALTLAVRDNATAAQKTLLFCAVAAMRVSPAFARALMGRVD